MKYLKNSHFTNELNLLDIAFFFALIPLVGVLSFPIYLLLLLGITFIFFQKEYKTFLVFFGLCAVFISSFVFKIENFGSLNWFVGLIIELLLWAVLLQRMTGKRNFYLVISPFLLMMLGLFFHTSIVALFYTVFELFVFTVLFLNYFMKSSITSALRVGAMMFFISLPVIVVLFLFFPRISFDRGEFGFSEEKTAISGHDGQMTLSSKALDVLSTKKVMEVEFLDGFPKENELYFRGSVLYEKKGDNWVEPENELPHKTLTQKQNIISYNVVLQPHYNHYIYALDYPVFAPKESFLTSGSTVLSQKSIVDEYRYSMRSALQYEQKDKTPFDSITFEKNKNLQTQNLLNPYQDLSQSKKIEKLNDLFIKADLSYTLKPSEYEMQNFVDSFLLKEKKGYCVHFASAYAQAARMLGISSRVVTGYLGKYDNKVQNYLVIQQKDAHAWVEIYDEKKGWIRVDPTTFAQNELNVTTQTSQSQKLQKYILGLNYIKYKIQTWVLNYNYLTQRGFFQNLMTNKEYLFNFLAFIIGLVVLGMAVFFVLKSSFCKDKVECAMQKLLKKLSKRGIVWDKKQSLHRFLLQHELEEIDRLYLQVKFSKQKKSKDFKLLQKLIKEI